MLGIKTRIKKYLRIRYGLFDELTYVRLSPIGYPCNHACVMCWRTQLIPKKRGELAKNELAHLTPGEYTTLFESLPKSVKNIDIVGGGEPLLYPNIISLCTHIKEKHIYGTLITNGALLDKAKIQELVHCGWDKIRISFHAGSTAVYRKIHRVDDFKKVVTNIESLLVARGKSAVPKVSLLYVIQKDNVSDIVSFVKLAEKLKVDSIEFDSLIPINPSTYLKPKQYSQIISSLKEIQKTIHVENNIARTLLMYKEHPLWNSSKRKSDYFKDKYCDTVQGNVDISSQGEVNPCCFAYDKVTYGNVRDEALPVLWKNHRTFRRNMAEGKFQPFCYERCTDQLPIR